MSAQISNHNFTNIGRMFARQNVSAVYGQQKPVADAEPEALSEQMDQVSLSPFVPKPFGARFFEEARDAGRALANGEKLAAADVERLREDRIFAAMSALAAIGDDGSDSSMRRSWPGGIPIPTPEEMEVARRRLSQRLGNVDEAADGAAAQRDRLELIRRIGKRDLSAFAAEESARIAGLAAAS